MSSLEDLWPLVEKYLSQTLQTENLSDVAERDRNDLLEKIEIAKLPPSLPPRPEEGVDHIAKLREASRQQFKRPDSVEDGTGELYDDISFDVEIKEEAEDVDDSGAYEQPQGQKREFIQPAEDSDTSYEDYDEDEFDSDDESNASAPQTEQIKLPSGVEEEGVYCNVDELNPVVTRRVVSKKRHKKYGGLENITFSGELICKGAFFGTEQKSCIIHDKKLLVFKNERSKKPQESIDIDAYEATYYERDDKHQHVIKLRKTYNVQGKEHWFCAETKDRANQWLQYFIVKEADKTSLGSNSLHDSGIQSGETASGSEGGSGDGQVPYSTQDDGPSADSNKIKDNRKKSIGDKILGTFGRKAGKSAKLEVIDAAFEMDPDALVAGVVEVMSEAMMNSKSWHKMYCQVKNGTFECYKRAGDENCEFSLTLKGLSMEHANINKHPLAYKLSSDDKPKLLIEPPDVIEQGKWLNVLIKETGVGSPQAKKSFSSEEKTEGETEDVYNDVYDHRRMPIQYPKGTPPPLPKNPPPVRTPPTIKRIFGESENAEGDMVGTYEDARHDRLREQQSDSENDDVKHQTKCESLRNQQQNGVDSNDLDEDFYDDVIEPNNNKSGKSSDETKSEAVEYKNTPSEVKNSPSEIGKSDDQTNEQGQGKQQAKKQVDALIKRLKANEQARKTNTTENKEAPTDPNVVRCSLGPTIAADEEILKAATNPILSELRNSGRKTWSPGEKEKVENEISELKKKVANLRRRRKDVMLAQIRSKKLNTDNPSEKANYEQELQALDKEFEETQKQLTKLQLLEEEKNAASSKGNSPVASPRSSFGKGSPRTTVERTQTTTRISTSRLSTTNTKSSAPLLMPVISSTKTTTTTTLRTKASTLPRKNTATTEPNWRSDRSTDRESEIKTSTYSRRSDTGTSKSSTLPKEVTSLSSPRSQVGQSSAGRGKFTASKTGPKPVQDRLKLWESMADSNC